MDGDKVIKVLFVDDEPNVLNAIRRIFIEENYEILTAHSAADGVEIMDGNEVPVVVSDYRMPDMNGIEFLRVVNSRWPDTVRIVLSGYADVASIVAAVNEGQIYKFIPKPWNDDELRMTIANAAERYLLSEKTRELTEELSRKNVELTNLNDRLNDLLKQKTKHLEFRNNVLVAYQKILDNIPAGIVGIDPDGTVVLCNVAWVRLLESTVSILDRPIEITAPDNIVSFARQTQREGYRKERISVNGIRGILSGLAMQGDDIEKGTIMIFMREDDI